MPVTDYRDIAQKEHEIDARARRVLLVDENGNFNPIDVTIDNAEIDITNLGDPKYGEVTSLAATSTDTVRSYTATAGDKLRGFITSGNRTAKFFLQINSTTVLSGRIEPGASTTAPTMPIAKSLSAGDTIELKVTNNGQGSGDFEGAIIIES